MLSYAIADRISQTGYFEFLPTEILYIILNNLSSTDIFTSKVLGKDIYKNHDVFFRNLIKRDPWDRD